MEEVNRASPTWRSQWTKGKWLRRLLKPKRLLYIDYMNYVLLHICLCNCADKMYKTRKAALNSVTARKKCCAMKTEPTRMPAPFSGHFKAESEKLESKHRCFKLELLSRTTANTLNADVATPLSRPLCF